jgi:hypothetical protein
MKWRLVAAAIILTTLAFQGTIPRTTKNESADQVKSNANANQKPPGVRPSTVTPNATNGSQGQSEKIASDDEKKSVRIAPYPLLVQAVKDTWDVALVICTGLLVLVGGFQILYLCRTIKAIKEQASIMRRNTEATEKSVRLQEVGLRQWVVIQDWQLRDKQLFMILEGMLTLTFDVFNPTDYPLTLESWTATIGGEKHAGTIRTLLPPQSPYLISIPIVTDRQENERFMQDNLLLAVVGSITFTDVLNDRQEQSFSQMCRCGQNISKFSRYEGAPDKTEGENPS